MINSTTQEIDLIEQLKNASGNMFEQASTMQTLCMQYRYTQAALAKRLSISQSSVGNKLRLLQFSSAERAKILDLGLSERHARAILRAQPHKRIKLIGTAGIMHLTVQQTEELVEKHGGIVQNAEVNTLLSSTINTDTFIKRTQSDADRLRSQGYKTTCLTESGEGWVRITVTIVD